MNLKEIELKLKTFLDGGEMCLVFYDNGFVIGFEATDGWHAEATGETLSEVIQDYQKV